MKVLLCRYRAWAVDACDMLVRVRPGYMGYEYSYARNPQELLDAVANDKFDVIVGVGWSWYIPGEITNSNVFIGMHPSDLPRYAGGSPIQNQIIDGVRATHATLFRVNEKYDDGRIIDKEPISLDGHLEDVLRSISNATYAMLLRFIDGFPNFTEVEQSEHGEGFTRRRLKPEQSRLTPERVKDMTCRQLWDFIRCREDPYPNVYMEDETGRLVIKRVEFEPK